MSTTLTEKWVQNFIRETTHRWATLILNPDLLGWQIQPETSWLPPYTESQIKKMEEELDWPLPNDTKTLLLVTSGLDKPQIHLGAYIDKSQKYKQQWQFNYESIENQDWRYEYNNDEIYSAIKEDNLILNFSPKDYLLLPLYAHRCIACNRRDISQSVVLSIHGNDVIIYGNNLQDYLQKEFLKD